MKITENSHINTYAQSHAYVNFRSSANITMVILQKAYNWFVVAKINQSRVSFVKRHSIICWYLDKDTCDWIILAANSAILDSYL